MVDILVAFCYNTNMFTFFKNLFKRKKQVDPYMTEEAINARFRAYLNGTDRYTKQRDRANSNAVNIAASNNINNLP